MRLKCLLARTFKYILTFLCHVTSSTDWNSFSHFSTPVSNWLILFMLIHEEGVSSVLLLWSGLLTKCCENNIIAPIIVTTSLYYRCILLKSFSTHRLVVFFSFVLEYLLLPPFHQSSSVCSIYQLNTKPTAVQQYTHSQHTDSKLLLSFPTTPYLRSQPPAKQTVLEISLQITLCLPNPPRSEGNQNPASPCPHRNRP